MKLKYQLKRISFFLFFPILALIINCGEDDTADDPSTVTASAGANQTVGLGEKATLTGSGVSSTGSDLDYSWELTTAPTGSSLSLRFMRQTKYPSFPT